MFTEKRYLVKFNSGKKYLLLIKQKQKKSNIPKRIWMKPCLKTSNDKSSCPLTTSGIILEWMQHDTIDHTLTFVHWWLIYLMLLTLTIMAPEQNSEKVAWAVFKILQSTCLRVFFYKVASLQACNVIKKETPTQVFFCEICEILKPILKNICEQLLLCIDNFIICWFLQLTTVHVFHFYK